MMHVGGTLGEPAARDSSLSTSNHTAFLLMIHLYETRFFISL